MDSELSRTISGLVCELVKAEHDRLEAAGTFIELEELACKIGDEVTRRLMGEALSERANELDEAAEAVCPDWGKLIGDVPTATAKEEGTAPKPAKSDHPVWK
ncbi:MAG: hypothetical protein KDB03_26130 [Planctomycetales bacterium]|nr:hypothetical protein [Planctomycetales bacterium]